MYSKTKKISLRCFFPAGIFIQVSYKSSSTYVVCIKNIQRFVLQQERATQTQNSHLGAFRASAYSNDLSRAILLESC